MFYTDEQLSMILSAIEATCYWDCMIESYAYTNKKMAMRAENEMYYLYDWLEVVSVWPDFGTSDVILKYLEKMGLA